MSSSDDIIQRRALRVTQSGTFPLYMFTLTADEVLRIADISRVARDDAGELIGYQRPEVRRHIQEIVEYLDGDKVIFPNPIILALSPSVRFTQSRGPHVSDGYATGGTLDIPLPSNGDAKPGWIVDGQQRAVALSLIKRRDFPVPINAFIADTVDIQREQFLRINNTRPLPRGLVTELLPAVQTPLPPRLSLRRTPSALCDLLNNDPKSPFFGLIKRSSTPKEGRRVAPLTDSSIVNMLQESLTSPGGCLFPYRNMASGETDFDGIWTTLLLYWNAVRETFPDAWGKPSSQSRLMHGAGIRAMGRLMDRVMAAINPRDPKANDLVQADLDRIAPYCRWTSGTWEGLDTRWNEIQNVPRHINELSNLLIRTHLQTQVTG